MEERRHCSKYTLTLTWFKSAISIPPELDGPETFHPTVGPKVNSAEAFLTMFYESVNCC